MPAKGKENTKFQTEARSVVVNLKIAFQQWQQDPANEDFREALMELINQMGEISEIYGINSMMSLSSETGKLLSAVSGGEASSLQTDCLSRCVSVMGELTDDPLLTDQKLKKAYNAAVKEAEELNHDSPEDETKMATSRFQEVFTEEAFDLINQLEEKMLQLESDPGDQTMIDSVFRIMHTLKGNSNMFGFRHLGEITHELENVYDDIRGGKMELSRDILEITLHCIDHFRHLIDDPEMESPKVRIHQGEMLTEIRSSMKSELQQADKDQLAGTQPEKKVLHTFYLHFKPAPGVFDDGTNPLYFVYDLHEMGRCLIRAGIHLPAPSKYKPEQCYTDWHILLVTESNDEQVREHFMFLSEESQPHIEILADGDLIANAAFAKYFTEQADTANGKTLKPDVSSFLKHKMESEHVNESSTKQSSDSISSVRVASVKIDQMMNLISELVTKQAELSMLAGQQDNLRLMEVAESIENISRDLRDNAFSISLIPLEKSVLRFQRLVRDVSNRFDKKVDFIVEGKETELDKTIIEKIIDPIMHILRNSIDHGIETPAERLKKGKPAHGTILLKAYPSGAHVVIEISDDGAGINLEKVRATAVKKGILQRTDTASDEDLLNLIVSPGFSTAENISEVSGRGVGMDVVNQKISEIRGELEIDTRRDEGTTITIRLPLTISIIDSLLMKVAGDYYLVPLGVVDRCAEVRAERIVNAQNKYIILNEEYIPFVDLRNEFGETSERPGIQQALLVKYKDMLVGIIVDEVIGNYQAVLKSLGSAYKKQEIISGASILGSGEIALVLDTTKIVQEYAETNELRVNAMA